VRKTVKQSNSHLKELGKTAALAIIAELLHKNKATHIYDCLTKTRPSTFWRGEKRTKNRHFFSSDFFDQPIIRFGSI
jgi:hypothetical protein